VEISRIYYDFLESNIDRLISVTTDHMLQDDEKVSIQAYEFWCSISDDEIRRLALNNGSCRFYTERALDTLWNTVRTHLMNRNAELEKLDEDAWSNAKAASTLLSNISQCTHERLIDYVFNLISECIQSDNAKIRDSTILAFGSVIETTHREKIRNIIPGAIPTLLNLLKDPSVDVRSTVAWSIKKMTEYHSECFANVEIYDQVVVTCFENLSGSKRVAKQLLDALSNLVINLRPDNLRNQQSGFISKHLEGLLPLLMQLAFTKDAYDPNDNIALGCFYLMGSLVDHAPMDTYYILNNFFSNIYMAYESTLDAANFPSQEQRYSYQCYIATVISACFSGEKVKMNNEQASAVYNLIKTSFEQRQGVYEEGLMACSSIALTLGTEFSHIIPDFGRFLFFALKQWQDVTLCRIAINSTSDLIRSMGPAMNNYIDQIAPLIMEILENDSSDKILKVQCFIVVADMFSHTTEEAIKHYNQIMKIVNSALQAACVLPDFSEDPDLVDYFRYLREYLLDCITCIFHCLQEIEQSDTFIEHVPTLINFINTICNDRYDPSVVRKLLYLYFTF
jgi:importin subunit beta-1